jgi:hypothetical protein
MGAQPNDIKAGFEQFAHDLDTMLVHENGESVSTTFSSSDVETVTARQLAGKTYNKCVDFLNSSNLFSGGNPFNHKFNVQGSENRLSSDMQNYNSLRSCITDLIALCEDCGISDKAQQKSTVAALATVLQRFSDPQATLAKHWASANSTDESKSAAAFYGSETDRIGDGEFSFEVAMPGVEAFGAGIDMVLPDVRAAMTVVLLKPHRGITERIFHKRTTASPVVRYVIPFDELFDLNKASDDSGKIRNAWDHRIPMLALYRDPAQINFTPIKIVPKIANDTAGKFVVANGILKFNEEIDLFDMAADPLDVGTKADHTSFVAEGVTLERVHLEITNTNTSVTEEFVVDVRGNPHSRLLMIEQPNDTGDRGTIMKDYSQFMKGVLTKAGAESAIFADVDEPNIVYLRLNLHAKINRKTSVTYADVIGAFEAASTREGVTPDQDTLDLVSYLKVTAIGYEIDAKYSEENVRMSSLVVRNNIYGRTYELPATRNFMFDYSIQQSQPEAVLDTISTIQQIGCDHRNIKLITDLFEQVYTQNSLELRDPMYRANVDNQTLNMRYAAGSRVNPTILMKQVKLADHIKNIRSADMFGDLRQFMDSYLTKLFSELHVRSLYVNQLDHGENPCYKVVTSIPILENLLSIPHIHDHLMPKGMSGEQLYGQNKGNSGVEYTRVLPSGVELRCMPCTFDYMRDTILIIPYREKYPESEYNLGHNYEFGTFAAHYMPIVNKGVHKRMLVNVREFPVPTNPMGGWITVVDLMQYLPDITINAAP